MSFQITLHTYDFTWIWYISFHIIFVFRYLTVEIENGRRRKTWYLIYIILLSTGLMMMMLAHIQCDSINYNWYYHIEYVPASSSSSQYLVKWYISNIMFFFFYHFLFRLSDNEIQILCEMICIKFMWNHMYEVLFEMTYIKYSVKWYIPSIMWNDVYQVFSEMIYIRPRCDCEVHKEAQTKKSGG